MVRTQWVQYVGREGLEWPQGHNGLPVEDVSNEVVQKVPYSSVVNGLFVPTT